MWSEGGWVPISVDPVEDVKEGGSKLDRECLLGSGRYRDQHELHRHAVKSHLEDKMHFCVSGEGWSRLGFSGEGEALSRFFRMLGM